MFVCLAYGVWRTASSIFTERMWSIMKVWQQAHFGWPGIRAENLGFILIALMNLYGSWSPYGLRTQILASMSEW